MTPGEHFEEAERLLERAKDLTEEWVVKAEDLPPTVTTAHKVKLLNLEILSRMLTARAAVHATLATAPYKPKLEPVSIPHDNGTGIINGPPL